MTILNDNNFRKKNRTILSTVRTSDSRCRQLKLIDLINKSIATSNRSSIRNREGSIRKKSVIGQTNTSHVCNRTILTRSLKKSSRAINLLHAQPNSLLSQLLVLWFAFFVSTQINQYSGFQTNTIATATVISQQHHVIYHHLQPNHNNQYPEPLVVQSTIRDAGNSGDEQQETQQEAYYQPHQQQNNNEYPTDDKERSYISLGSSQPKENPLLASFTPDDIQRPAYMSFMESIKGSPSSSDQTDYRSHEEESNISDNINNGGSENFDETINLIGGNEDANNVASQQQIENKQQKHHQNRFGRQVGGRNGIVATQQPQAAALTLPLRLPNLANHFTARSQQAPQSQSLTANSAQPTKCALILQRTYVKKVPLASDDSLGGDDLTGGIDSAAATSSGNGGSFTNLFDNILSLGQSARSPNNNNNNNQQHKKRERICIRFQDVNEAIKEAKYKLQFQEHHHSDGIQSLEPPVETIAAIGELNQEVTRILATKFDLSNDEILNGLPLIDMSKTNFWSICPLMVRPIQCQQTRYRSFTGHCNNLKYPAWGAAQTPFVRYLPPVHPDGIQAERVSVDGGLALPSPRLVTSLVHRDHDQPSGELSLLIMVWGQIIDHDVALAAPPRDENGMDFNCCKRQHPNCKPIEIPENDHLYSRYNMRCMDFKRSLAGLRPNCALGPRVHINTITATIDANTIYGSTKDIADKLRLYQGGLLKVQDVFANVGLKPLLPPQLEKPDLDCFARPANSYCFFGGDERVNEQPTLTLMHTLYVRDHNRMARALANVNPHWDDDKLYHETRHIQAAMVQQILLNEYLPLLIGHEMMQLYNLTLAQNGAYWDGYDPNVTPSISQGFSTAAFRQGHTFIQGKVRRYNRNHEYLGFENLRTLFKRPFHYYQAGRMDEILTGVLNTPAQTYDPFITEEISGHLFQEPGEHVGMDLPAINLARGREQGTPGYNYFREWCGLPRAQTFDDLQPYMNNNTAYHYSRLYRHVDDIDLWSGGISERRLPGSQVGPTFACIIARQFSNIRRGDRFWFENSNSPSSFTLNQLAEIRKATQARLFCYNSDYLTTIQPQVLKLPHPIYNARVPCSQIPDLDMSPWQEEGGGGLGLGGFEFKA